MGLYHRHVLPRIMHLAMGMHLLEAHRQRLASQAQGIVLELGFGSGLNLPFYDVTKVQQLYALEPEEGMLELARARIDPVPLPVEVLQAGAEQIPLPDQSVDTILCTWTLCTIPDIEQALVEARRVLKPGGQFLFTEHGLSPEPRVARWQHRMTPLWRRCAGGCHLNREADVLLQGAGFDVISVAKEYLGPLKIMTYMYEGRAQLPNGAAKPKVGTSNVHLQADSSSPIG
ncbi:methyltransferase family protein [Modicisalibacter xianhensis]|uniref:Methyltransferase family protein n=1 Tax=Modicisalibacter xianhensis TaxID=442341 RepID=A0A4R8G4U7_9GAMM|nr:class I SAM-dependent methyltransferase [Halomonas xianhensis]TDX31659.1 methyltransferase family protein [Halomonas xianhensis]